MYTGGVSCHAGMNYVREWMKVYRGSVHTVVDFGFGQGFLGGQARHYLRPSAIHGCDVYGPMVEKAQAGDLYTSAAQRDLLDYARDPETPRGDGVLWMFGDVLEHLEEADALALLNGMAAQHVLLRIPVGPYPQPPRKENPAEAHLWTFYPDLLDGVPADVRACIAPLPKATVQEVVVDLGFRPQYAEPKAYIGNFWLERK